MKLVCNTFLLCIIMNLDCYGGGILRWWRSFFFHKQCWILLILDVSSAGRVKELDWSLWVWSPLKSLIVSKLCEIDFQKTWHACKCNSQCFAISKHGRSYHEYVNTVTCLKLMHLLPFCAGYTGLCCICC
jgi:hypothetical protein